MNGGRSSGVPHTPDTPPAALPPSPGWPPRAADSRPGRRPGIGSSREKGAAERRPRRTSASRAARRFRASSHCARSAWARSRSHSAQSRRPFGQLDFAVIVLYITYPETLNKYQATRQTLATSWEGRNPPGRRWLPKGNLARLPGVTGPPHPGLGGRQAGQDGPDDGPGPSDGGAVNAGEPRPRPVAPLKKALRVNIVDRRVNLSGRLYQRSR
jgi:hypothetical protein